MPKNSRGAIIAVSAFGLLILAPRLLSGLWLDELATYWAIQGSLAEVAHRSSLVHHQSPFYYLILRVVTALLGSSELALRALSVASILIAAAFVLRLGELLFRREVGIYAAFIFLNCILTLQAGGDARPYAFTIMLLLASTWALFEWCRSLTPKSLLIYCLLVVGVYYAHYLYVAFFPVHAAFALMAVQGRSREERTKLFRQGLCGVAMIAALAAPSLIHLRFISAKTGELLYIEQPTFAMLRSSLVSRELYILLALVAVFRFTIWRKEPFRWNARGDARRNLFFAFLLATLPPLILFILCRGFGYSCFVGRYWGAREAGTALLAGALIDAVLSPRRAAAIMVLFLSIALYSEYDRTVVQDSLERWNQASAAIRERDPKHECTLLLMSGLIETQNTRWLLDPEISSYIRCPLEYYPVENPVVLLPYTFETGEAAEYLNTHVKPKIADARCLWLLYRSGGLLIGGKQLTPSPAYLDRTLPDLEFRRTDNLGFGIVDLFRYEKVAPSLIGQ